MKSALETIVADNVQDCSLFAASVFEQRASATTFTLPIIDWMLETLQKQCGSDMLWQIIKRSVVKIYTAVFKQ